MFELLNVCHNGHVCLSWLSDIPQQPFSFSIYLITPPWWEYGYYFYRMFSTLLSTNSTYNVMPAWSIAERSNLYSLPSSWQPFKYSAPIMITAIITPQCLPRDWSLARRRYSNIGGTVFFACSTFSPSYPAVLDMYEVKQVQPSTSTPCLLAQVLPHNLHFASQSPQKIAFLSYHCVYSIKISLFMSLRKFCRNCFQIL